MRVRVNGEDVELTEEEYGRMFNEAMDRGTLKSIQFKGMKAGEEPTIEIVFKED